MNLSKARIAAIEARNAPDLDEATKAIEWHMGESELLKAAKNVLHFFVYLESIKGEGARGALNLLRKAVRDLEEKAQ